jgi:hypothetical protein
MINAWRSAGGEDHTSLWMFVYMISKRDMHPEIKHDARFQTYCRLHYGLLTALQILAPTVSFVSDLPDTQSIKNPRRVPITHLWNRPHFIQHAMDRDLFVQCDQALTKTSPSAKVLVIPQPRHIVQSAIRRVGRMEPWWALKYLALTGGDVNHCFLIAEDDMLQKIRAYLACDFASDSKALCPYPFTMVPTMYDWYKSGSDIHVYSVLRAVLRWIVVTRARGKHMAQPGDLSFRLYRQLHTVVGYFKGEVRGPAFKQALRAWIQLKLPHYVPGDLLCDLHYYFTEETHMQRVFPQVYDMISGLLPSQFYESHVPLNCHFRSIPGHVFLYGMAIHPSVPLDLKRSIFLKTHVLETFRSPHTCPGRGIHTASGFRGFLATLERESRDDEGGIEASRMDMEYTWFVRWPEYRGNALEIELGLFLFGG